jgi:hypothetical protein
MVLESRQLIAESKRLQREHQQVLKDLEKRKQQEQVAVASQSTGKPQSTGTKPQALNPPTIQPGESIGSVPPGQYPYAQQSPQPTSQPQQYPGAVPLDLESQTVVQVPPGQSLSGFIRGEKTQPPGEQIAQASPQSLSPTEHFKQKLSQNAQKRLQSNSNRLESDLKDYGNLSPNNPKWQQLRQLSQQDQQLVGLNQRLNRQIGDLQMKDLRETPYLSPNIMVDRNDIYPDGVVDPKIQAQIKQLEAQQNLIGVARRQMQAQYPALAVIDSAIVANSSNAQLLGKIGEGFGKIQFNIKDLSQQIQKDPSKALFLDDVVKGTLNGLQIDPNNPNQSATNKAIVDYLKGEQTKDNLIKWGGTILTGGLTIGAILVTMGTGGAALPFALGLGGALTGFGTTAYEYRELATVDLAAQSQQGGTKLTSQDKDTARFNLMMGRINLLMAGLDVGLSVKAATGLLRGAKSVEQMSTFTKAMKAQKAGELGDALDALQPMRKELGENAYKEIERAWVQATGSRYVGIDADVTPKLIRQYENLARLSEKEIGEIVKNTGIPRKFINRVQEHL